MAKKQYKPERIIRMLRQAEVLASQGKTVPEITRELYVSERRSCRVLSISRSVQRHQPRRQEDEERLRRDIVRLAGQYGRYGYRRITTLLRTKGWHVNHKRVERIWREEGLRVPKKQPKSDGWNGRVRDWRPVGPASNWTRTATPLSMLA